MKILSCELKFDSMLHDFDTSIWFTFSEFADSWKMMRSFSIKFCRLQKKNQRRKMEKLPVSFFFSFYSGIWNLTTMHFWQYVEFKTDIQKSLCRSLKKISVTTFINVLLWFHCSGFGCQKLTKITTVRTKMRILWHQRYPAELLNPVNG